MGPGGNAMRVWFLFPFAMLAYRYQGVVVVVATLLATRGILERNWKHYDYMASGQVGCVNPKVELGSSARSFPLRRGETTWWVMRIPSFRTSRGFVSNLRGKRTPPGSAAGFAASCSSTKKRVTGGRHKGTKGRESNLEYTGSSPAGASQSFSSTQHAAGVQVR